MWLLAGAALVGIAGASAQESDKGKPKIVVAQQITAQELSQQPFPITIEPAGALPADHIVRVLSTEIPLTSLEFSSGRIDPGFWSIPVGDLAGLKLKVLERTSESSWLIIGLVDSGGTILTTASTRLVVEPGKPDAVAAAARAAAKASEPPAVASQPAAASPAPAKESTAAAVPPAAIDAQPPRSDPPAARAAAETPASPPPERAPQISVPLPPAVTSSPVVTANPSPPPAAATGMPPPVERVASVGGGDLKPRSPEPVAQPDVAKTSTAASGVPVAAPKPEAPAQVALAPSAPPVTAPPSLGSAAPPADRAPGDRLIDLGDRHIAQGNVALARQYFQRAAEMGLATAAFKLAETYDPVEIARMKAQGLKPDPGEAKRWYDRAAGLGAVDAESRLRRLSAR